MEIRISSSNLTWSPFCNSHRMSGSGQTERQTATRNEAQIRNHGAHACERLDKLLRTAAIPASAASPIALLLGYYKAIKHVALRTPLSFLHAAFTGIPPTSVASSTAGHATLCNVSVLLRSRAADEPVAVTETSNSSSSSGSVHSCLRRKDS